MYKFIRSSPSPFPEAEAEAGKERPRKLGGGGASEGESFGGRENFLEKMHNNGEEESLAGPGSSSSPSPSHANLRQGPDAVLITCRVFSVVTAVFAVFCIVVNVFSAIRSFEDGSDVFDGIFRCYAVVIACFVVLAETEWNFIIKFWKVLEYWVGRGMLQIFVAVMTRAFPNYNSEKKELVFLQNLASYLLLGCGGVYVISGILCLGCLKRSRQKKQMSRAQAVKEFEELERRREELQQLLIMERA